MLQRVLVVAVFLTEFYFLIGAFGGGWSIGMSKDGGGVVLGVRGLFGLL